MNGVRRFLGAATSSPPPSTPQDPQPLSPQSAPLAFNPRPLAGPSWPPASPTQAESPQLNTESLKPTAALSLKKERQKSQSHSRDEDVGSSSFQSRLSGTLSAMPSTPNQAHASYTSSNSSPSRLNGLNSPASATSQRMLPHRLLMRKSLNQNQPGAEWKRSSGLSNTRDELLISLLASQAVVDSRDFEILGSEEVDELKKEYQVLNSRLEATRKKLSLETKIRDAAVSLTRVNASHKRVSKQTDEQLDAANRRVDAAQAELWRVAERANEVHRRLLEHRAGVLSFSVRSMENKMGPPSSGAINGNGIAGSEDSGYDSSNRSTLMSPTTSSMTGVSVSSTSKARFDGAHLFAGHVDAVIPRQQLSSEAAVAEITGLEGKLKAATEALSAAGKKQVALTRELSLMRLEKQEVETIMGMDLQSAEERAGILERELEELRGVDKELGKLQEEKRAWEEKRARLEEKAKQVGDLERRLAEMEARTGGEAAGTEKLLADSKENSRRTLKEKEEEIQRSRQQLEAERAFWEREKAAMEDEKVDDLARLQDEMAASKEADAVALQNAHEELDAGLTGLRKLVQQHAIVLFSRDSSLQGLVQSIGTHLESVHGKLDAHGKLEAEWEAVRRKLEDDVRGGLDKRETLARDLEEARRERDEAKSEVRVQEALVKEISDNASTLRSSGSSSSIILPGGADSASKLIATLQPIWSILPSPEARAAKFNHSRQFRTGSGSPSSPGNGGGNSVSSLSDLDVRSLKSLYETIRTGQAASPNIGTFTIEGFAARVQALVADDRALIERLVRFAQAHDLLKKNAERAQKLAQEGNSALETYQKQVRILEERNMSMAGKQAAMQEEIQQLQDSMERIAGEKREVEMQAAEQAETCRQLTEANNTLSARTLTLAEEAASAPEIVRKHLEGQLAECRMALDLAQDEVDAMRMSEQSQRIALLDELNSMQTENGALRAQLRARK